MGQPDETDVMTVEAAWATYELAEAELWAEYASDPTYLKGRVYLAGERFARRRCERAVEAIRYKHPDLMPRNRAALASH